ncbi:hypothetical protein KAU51_00130 [Candidatus Parcubacteria bacterium]|nr:hypothetical protein [Candidatus Parcubacteria bacterium]
MVKKGKLVRISEEMALIKARELISGIYRGDKRVYSDTEETEAEEISGIAGIKKV